VSRRTGLLRRESHDRLDSRRGPGRAAAARLRRGLPDARQRLRVRGRGPGGPPAPDAPGRSDRRDGRLDYDGDETALDQRPQVSANPSRVIRGAVAAGAAARRSGAGTGIARRAGGFAVARLARAPGAIESGRAGGLPAARGVWLRVCADRRHHRADRGQLAPARDAGAEASRGQPPALRRRRGRPRRLAPRVSDPARHDRRSLHCLVGACDPRGARAAARMDSPTRTCAPWGAARRAFGSDNAANTPHEQLLNSTMVSAGGLQNLFRLSKGRGFESRRSRCRQRLARRSSAPRSRSGVFTIASRPPVIHCRAAIGPPA